MIKTARSMRHISTSIEGLENLTNYRLKKMAPDIKVDGVPLRTAAQVRRMLREAKAEGFRFIPAEGCDHYDSEGRCLGHVWKEEDNAAE